MSSVGFSRPVICAFSAMGLLGFFMMEDFTFCISLEASLAFSWMTPLSLFHFSIIS